MTGPQSNRVKLKLPIVSPTLYNLTYSIYDTHHHHRVRTGKGTQRAAPGFHTLMPLGARIGIKVKLNHHFSHLHMPLSVSLVLCQARIPAEHADHVMTV